MSDLTDPTQVYFFCSCLWTPEIKIKALISEKFELSSELLPSFNPLKEYYSKEMGQEIERGIWVDKRLKSREALVELKMWADKLERKNSKNNKRLVNIDVGYIAKEQLLLATGKPYSHRIYLNSGVFAELVYTYQAKSFNSLSWTYPDYQHEEKIAFFNANRP